MRYILHIDMDAFYASVEELHNPLYRNKPIAVSGHTKRSVIASANYIARSCGVKAAMPVFMAKNICRNLIIAYPHFHLYEELSERFTKLICEKFTNNIEIASIDECYVDITNLVNKKHSAIDVAKAIQNTIKSKIGLTCSIGIANNKFLAKMGSKYKKPLGITTM
jgi:DNA polymerase-4